MLVVIPAHLYKVPHRSHLHHPIAKTHIPNLKAKISFGKAAILPRIQTQVTHAKTKFLLCSKRQSLLGQGKCLCV